MNKKYIAFSLFGLLALTLVSAGAIYYNVFSTTFNVAPSIVVEGDLSFEISEDIISGELIEGSLITINNIAPSERTISIIDDSNEDIEVSYIGTLELTKKDSNWISTGEVKFIEYTVVGDSFGVSGIPEGYELIYYKDGIVGLEGRLENPQPAIAITSNIGNLPQIDDFNNDATADYCNNEVDDYTSCRGAKIWLIPTGSAPGGVIDWARMNEFYFETNLIQYNAEGNIIIYSGSALTITPVYEVSDYAEGTYTIITIIA